MKLLHIITGLSTGGAERALYNVLAGGLAQSGKSVVLSLRDKGAYGQKIRDLGVPVYTLGMQRGVPGPLAVTRLRRLVRSLRPAIVQGWMYHGNLAAWLAQRMAPGRPALAWNIRHSLYGLSGEKRATRQVIRANRWLSGAPDALLYNSHLSRHQHEAFGLRSDKGQVIPNGFDLAALGPDPVGARAVRASLGIPEEALVIGHVARFHPMKDHARFVRAAVRAAQSREDVHVLLVGRDVVAANAALATHVPEPLGARFHWLGEREDVHGLMRAMDVLCLSSAWGEAFPNVLGEAMATGVPCVATDVGDSALIVGDTGVVVPAEDDNALFNGLMTLLDKAPAERRALGRGARERIESHFGLAAVVNEYANLYENLAAIRRPGEG
jgi:glycosyltransferase involved in cell wall biosynthesis